MTLNDLTDQQTIFSCIAGSHAYGTQHAESDVDMRGIFMLPARQHLSLTQAPKQISDATNDVTYYELRRYFELALACNPNIIELLWTPEDCIKRCTPVMDLILAKRELFLSRQAYQTFSGYAFAQIKRARGQNKWVNNPQPKDPPARESYCWIISEGQGNLPMRPVPLTETTVTLADCHAAKLEHAADCFRLYQYSSGEARGVFRGDSEVVVESIPLDDERTRFVGLLLFARQAYERDRNNWKHYWEWRAKRNESRYRAQEAGEIDYDAKNLMHCLRLLWSGKSILENGLPIVRFSGAALQTLLDVRHGRFSYDEVMDLVETEKASLAQLHACSDLPKSADAEAVNTLYLNCLRTWEQCYDITGY